MRLGHLSMIPLLPDLFLAHLIEGLLRLGDVIGDEPDPVLGFLDPLLHHGDVLLLLLLDLLLDVELVHLALLFDETLVFRDVIDEELLLPFLIGAFLRLHLQLKIDISDLGLGHLALVVDTVDLPPEFVIRFFQHAYLLIVVDGCLELDVLALKFLDLSVQFFLLELN